MDLLAALRNNQLDVFKRTFVWTSQDGRRLAMDEMDSVHMLNATNLIIRRLRDRVPHFSEHNRNRQQFFIRGGNTYQSNNAHGAEPMLNQVFYFCWELERRSNFARNGDRVRFLNLMRSIFDERFLRVDLATAIHGAEAANRANQASSQPLTDIAEGFLNSLFGSMPDLFDERPSRRDRPPESDDPIGVRELTGAFMQSSIRFHAHSGALDLNDWLNAIPAPFSNEASRIAQRVFNSVRPRTRTRDTLSIMIAEFQSAKMQAIAEGTLTRNGWYDGVATQGTPQATRRFEGTPAVTGIWEERFLSNNPFDLISTTDAFSIEQLNMHLEVTRHSNGAWVASLSGHLMQRLDSDFNSHIPSLDRDVAVWLRSRTREFANHSTAQVREVVIRHIYAILEHNLQHGSLTRERWANYLPLNMAPPQTGRFSTRTPNLSTFPRPETPEQGRRNPLIMLQAQPMDYRPSNDWSVEYLDTPKKKKVNRKDEANDKKKAELAAELAAKHEEALVGVNKRKIQAD